MVRLALLAFVGLFLSSDLTLSSEPSRELTEVLKHINSQMNSADSRAEFVESLSTYCSKSLEDIPTNTPDENNWVKTEGKTTDSNKIGRLLASPEWARHVLAQTYSECVDTTQKIELAQAANNTKAEAALLLSLSISLNDDNDFAIYARNASVDSERYGITWINTIRRLTMVAALRAIEEI
jgi:hypothetical protein